MFILCPRCELNYIDEKDDYCKMMDMLCSYTVAGKNKHDDVPDGMAMLSEYAQSFNRNKVEIFSRYF